MKIIKTDLRPNKFLLYFTLNVDETVKKLLFPGWEVSSYIHGGSKLALYWFKNLWTESYIWKKTAET